MLPGSLELAERLLAHPGAPAYGAVSALMSLRAAGRILRRVGNEVFWPRPDVASAVVRLEFKPWGDPSRDRQGADADRLLTRAAQMPAPLRREEAEPFQRFLQKLFSHRRKMLRAVLGNTAVLETLRLLPTARAEELPPETLLALFRLVHR
ncbi:MAG: hypothetical protein NTW87_09095 [Planctomycetota bacterium]|nr:hypothetical protein [Planctomycetota bacterium]